MKPFLFVALDRLSRLGESLYDLSLVKTFRDYFIGYKINLDALLHNSIKNQLAIMRRRTDAPLFVDLKMWNGSRTMVDVAKQLVELQVDYFNIHALADDQIPPVIEAVKGSMTKVLGVTVLTHYDEGYCQKHFKRSHADTVKHLAKTALDRGCHGVILPGTALDFVRDFDGMKVVPGIRPSWYEDSRHSQEVTPTYAREHGADIVVCGSPITKASDPVGALKKVLEELNS